MVTFLITWFLSVWFCKRWVSGVPCHHSLEFLDDFLWNFYSKWVSTRENGKITMFQLMCGAYWWLWNACMYDEIVPCSVTSDMTPFSSWMPITEFDNIFFVSVGFWLNVVKTWSLKNAIARLLVESPVCIWFSLHQLGQKIPSR